MKHAGTIQWDDAQVIELTSLWAAGFTAQRIADQFGTSRSAVCGKVRRLMLPIRVTHITERKPLSAATVRQPPPLRIEPPALGPVGDFPDGAGCRYIAGDPASPDWQCCGAPTPHTESRWCEFHHGVVFTPTKPRPAKPEPRRWAA